MSQQVKDVYSGFKKIFPASRRNSNFSFAGRISLGDELSADAQAAVPSNKSNGRHSSFSFSGWKDKNRTSSEPVVMSLPYGATAATPKSKKAADDEERNSLTKSLNNAFTKPRRSSIFRRNSKEQERHSTSVSGRQSRNNSTGRNSTSSNGSDSISTSLELSKQPPKLGSRSISVGEEKSSRLSGRMLHNNDHSPLATPSSCSNGNSKNRYSQRNKVRSASHNLAGFSLVKKVPHSYQSSSTSFADLTTANDKTGENEAHQSFQQRKSLSSHSEIQEIEIEVKKEGRLSIFSKKTEKLEPEEVRGLNTTKENGKPHTSTWDSDSDDDYEDTKHPSRGLDRRSQSMDFMEQAPTHLISKIWRKLPIQARLIGGRGSIDLDLQKDRTSFTRSSEARKFALAAEKAKAAELYRRSISGYKESSPVAAEDLLPPGVTKRTRFSLNPTIVVTDGSDGAAGAYAVLESYDDVLVRVCKFAAHDQRPTTTKVQDFLERSMAYLHGSRTKHGNIANISNEEIRMWRRLALHDWTLEEVTTAQAAAALGVKGKDVEAPSSRSSSYVTESTDSDSETNLSCRNATKLLSGRSLSRSVAEEEPEGEEDEEDLEVPLNAKLNKLCEVVNYCVNFGELFFTLEEVNDLIRLEFIVEEDGWI